MEFAINFSHVAADLLRVGTIRLDAFKTPDWPDMVAEAGKLLPGRVHLGLNAGADDSQTKDWNLGEQILQRTGTSCVNLHLAARARDFPGDDRRAVTARLIAD